MTKNAIQVKIFDDLGDENIVVPMKYSITSYGADYTIDSLVARIKSGAVFIPSFQRGFVWDVKEASRFIESLLLGLPIPGIFLARDGASQKMQVIDGQQRLRTLQYFYDGVFSDSGKEFSLVSVQKEFLGLTYKKLAEGDKIRLDDAILHATVVKQDEPNNDNSSIYHIFERINTGGTQLYPQEIRASIYYGTFNDLIRDLNKNVSWRKVYGPFDKLMRDQELILRFLALYFYAKDYIRPMKDFLNRYMSNNRNFERQSEEMIRSIFLPTIELIANSIGSEAFKPKKNFNAASFDAIMVGLARRLENGKLTDAKELKIAHSKLLSNEIFNLSTTRGTASPEAISRRIKAATDAFANLT